MVMERLFDAFRNIGCDDEKVNFERVSSKSITEIGYDAGSRTLSVIYHNGFIYTASDFPKSEFDKLRSCDFDDAYPEIVLSHFQLKRTGRVVPLFM